MTHHPEILKNEEQRVLLAFFLDEFPPLRGLKIFFCIFLLLLHLSGGARKMEQKQKDTKEESAEGARTQKR